jgi:AP-3 complex subunit mu
MYFLAVCQQEVPPLLVIEFLHRVGDIFTEYFERMNENLIRENFVTVYQVRLRLIIVKFICSHFQVTR